MYRTVYDIIVHCQPFFYGTVYCIWECSSITDCYKKIVI